MVLNPSVFPRQQEARLKHQNASALVEAVGDTSPAIALMEAIKADEPSLQ